MVPHVCKPYKACRCSMNADEPNENCPVHGFGDDRRCGTCGRFLARPDHQKAAEHNDPDQPLWGV